MSVTIIKQAALQQRTTHERHPLQSRPNIHVLSRSRRACPRTGRPLGPGGTLRHGLLTYRIATITAKIPTRRPMRSENSPRSRWSKGRNWVRGGMGPSLLISEKESVYTWQAETSTNCLYREYIASLSLGSMHVFSFIPCFYPRKRHDGWPFDVSAVNSTGYGPAHKGHNLFDLLERTQDVDERKQDVSTYSPILLSM
jgi:hypothetical protein